MNSFFVFKDTVLKKKFEFFSYGTTRASFLRLLKTHQKVNCEQFVGALNKKLNNKG